MMGHASITSTQTYAKISEKKIAEDMDRLIERRKNNEYWITMKREIITISENGNIHIPTATIWMSVCEVADLFGVLQN